ncbi:MAG TPA: polyketide synthase, partial [Anaerolineae bacterium]|nr:polyketide synthase [Anaerolineae bacterium]
MDKIAIIGISTLFPDAATPQQYWQNLVERKDSRSAATADQMGVSAEIFYNPAQGTQDKYYCLQGGYVRDFVFDAAGDRLPAAQIEGMDDLFKWGLYVADQALEDARIRGGSGKGKGERGKEEILKRTGVVLGNLLFPTQKSHFLFEGLYREAVEGAVGELLV